MSYSLKLQTYISWSMQGTSGSPALKKQTSADSSQAETASLESCCSASSAHGTARTEAQRLGLLACLTPSKFKCTLGGPCQQTPATLLRKCERLQIAGRQKGLAWKAVAQPHLPMALLTQRHRGTDTGAACLSCTSNFKRRLEMEGSQPGSFRSPAPKMRTSADS